MALSLRMKVGEYVTVCDASGRDFQCVIEQIAPDQARLRVRRISESAGEPRVRVTLYQALPKGDKFEQIVQKAVELGVYNIVPVLSRRCVSRPDEKTMSKKLDRYNKIALEAAKQCGRGRIVQVSPLIPFAQAVRQMGQSALPLFFYENADTPLRTVLQDKRLEEAGILVGSEGGFDPEEAQLAQQAGLTPLSLGSRILRCETAPLAALTAVMYAAGEF